VSIDALSVEVWAASTTLYVLQELTVVQTSGVPMNFVRGGSQQIQSRTEDKDLGAVAPYSGVLEAAGIWYKKLHFI